MLQRTIPEEIRSRYLNTLRAYGENGICKHVVRTVPNVSDNIDVEILELSDAFFSMYRRSGDDDYFAIGRALRRAAHMIYRNLLKNNNNKRPNFKRFLNGL